VKFLRNLIVSLSRVPETPERIAFAFSAGVFIGFSPLLGLHTVLGVFCILLFRLNKVATMLGVWSNVPWIVVPYYGLATWLGVKILGMPKGIRFPRVGFYDLLGREFWVWLVDQWRLLIPAFLGSLILCTALACLAYPVALILVRSYRKRFEVSREDISHQATRGTKESRL
jgi:uncharacterized protein (DUF2062 family)